MIDIECRCAVFLTGKFGQFLVLCQSLAETRVHVSQDSVSPCGIVYCSVPHMPRGPGMNRTLSFGLDKDEPKCLWSFIVVTISWA